MNSSVVDQRIVEMTFDNENFEKNISQSIQSLGNLDKSIQNAGSGDGLGFIGKIVESLGQKFHSAIDNIAIGALRRLGEEAYQTGKKLVSSLTIDQVTAGWGKYTDKTQGVQTIMAATGKSIDEVNAQLEKLMWFTDETSYNFTDMVSNIGKFTSAGVELDTSVKAMEGIANWAAISGAGVNEASRAMYNMAQAISVGSVKLMDWKSIENANMATQEFKQTAIDTAIELGTLKKDAKGTITTLASTKKKIHEVSAKNFNENLSDAWFTSEVLLKTLERYSEYSEAVYEYMENAGGSISTANEAMKEMADRGMVYAELGMKAFKAAQEAKTLEEAINSVKDAVSSGWMTTFELIFGNYVEAKSLWTDLANWMYDVFAEGGNQRNEVLDEAMNMSGWDKLTESIIAAGVAEDDFKKALAEAAGTNLDALTKKYGSFEESLQAGWINADIYNAALDKVASTTEKVTDNTKAFDEIVKRTMKNEFGTGDARKKKLAELGWNYAAVQNEINKQSKISKRYDESKYKGQTKTIAKTKEQTEALKKLKNEARMSNEELNEILAILGKPTGHELFVQGLYNLMDAIHNDVESGILDVFRNSLATVIPEATPLGVYNLIGGFESLTGSLVMDEYAASKLQTVFVALLSPIKILEKLVGSLFKGLSNNLSDLQSGFGIAKVMPLIMRMIRMFNVFIDSILNLEIIDTLFDDFGKVVVDTINDIFTAVDNVAGVFADEFNTNGFTEAIKKAVEWALTEIDNFVKMIGDSGVISTVIKSIADRISAYIKIVGSLFKALFSNDVTSSFGKSIGRAFGDALAIFGDLIVIFGTIRSAWTNFVTSLIDKMSNIEGVSSVFSFLFNILEVIYRPLHFIRTVLDELASSMKGVSTLSGVFDGILNAIQNLASSKLGLDISPLISDLHSVVKFVSDIVQAVTGAISKLFGDLSADNEIASKLSRITEGFRAVGDIIGEVIRQIGIYIGNALTYVGEFSYVVDDVKFDSFVNAAHAVISAVLEIIATFADSIVKASEWAKSNDVIQATIKFLGKAALVVVAAIVELIKYITELVKTSDALTKFKDKVSDVFNKFKDLLTGKLNFDTVKESVLSFVDSVKQRFGKFLEYINGVKTEKLAALADVFNKLRDYVSKAADRIKNAGKNVKSTVSEFGKSIKTNKKVVAAYKVLSSAAKKVSSAFKQMFGVLVSDERLTSRFTRIFNGMKAAIEIVAILFGRFADLIKRGFDKISAAIGSPNASPLVVVFKLLGKAIGVVSFVLLEFLARIGDALVAVRDWLKEHYIIQTVMGKVKSVFQGLIDMYNNEDSLLRKVVDAMVDKFKELGQALDELFQQLADPDSNIRQFFSEMAENVGENISSVIEWFGKAKDAIGDFGGELLGIKGPEVQIESLGSALGDFFTKFTGHLADGELSVVSLGNELKWFGDITAKEGLEKAPELLKSIGGYFSGMGSSVIGFGKNLKETAKDTKVSKASITDLAQSWDAALASTEQDTKNVLTDTSKHLDTFVDGFARGVSQLPSAITDNLGAGIAVATMLFSRKFVDNVNNVSNGLITTLTSSVAPITTSIDKIAGAFTSAGKSIGIIAGSIRDYLHTQRMRSWGKIILSFAASIAILAASMLLISTLDPQDIFNAAAAITVIAIAMSVLLGMGALLAKFSGGFDGMVKSIIAFSLTMSLLVGALYLLTKFNVDDVITSIFKMGFLAVILGALFFAFGKLEPLIGKAGGSVTGMIGIALSMFILAATFSVIGIMPIENVRGKFDVIVLIIASLCAVMMAIKAAGPQLLGAAVGLLLLEAVSMKLVTILGVLGLVTAAMMSKAALGVAAVGVVIMVAVALGMLVKVTKSNGSFAAIAATLVGMTIAMIGLSVIATLIGAIGGKSLLKGVIAVVGLLAGISLIMLSISRLNKDNVDASKTITSIAVAIGALAFIFALLSFISDENAEQALERIAVLMAGLTAMVFAAGGLKKAGAAIWGLVALLAGMVAAITYLQGVSLDNALPIVLMASSVLFALGIMMRLISNFRLPKKGGMTMFWTMIASLSLVFGAVAGLTYVLNNGVDYRTLAVAVGGMAVLMIALGAMMKILDWVTFVPKFSSIASMAFVVIAIGAVIGALSVLNGMYPMGSISTFLTMVGSIALLMLAMGAMMKIIDIVQIDKSAVKALLPMIVVIAALGAILTAISFVPMDASPENLSKLIVMATSIGILMLALGKSLSMLDMVEIPKSDGLLGMATTIVVFTAIAAFILAGMMQIPMNGVNDFAKMITIAISLSIVVLALSSALRIISQAKIRKGTIAELKGLSGVIVSLGAVLAVMALVANIVDPSHIGVLVTMTTMLGLVLLAFAYSINIMSGVNLSSYKVDAVVKLVKSIGGVLAVLGIIVGVMTVIASRLGGNNVAAMAGVIIGIVSVILSCALALKLLNGVSIDKSINDALSTIVALVALACVSMFVMLAAVKSAGNPNLEMLFAMIIGMASVILTAAAAFKIMNGVTIDKSIGENIKVLAALIGGAIVAIAAIAIVGSLSTASLSEIAAFTLSLITVLLSIALAMKLISGVKIETGAKAVFAAIGPMLIMAIATIGIMMLILNSYGSADVGSLIGIAVSLGILILAMAGVCKIISGVKVDNSSIGIIVTLGIIMILLGVMLAAVTSLIAKNPDPASMLGFAASLAILMIALGVVLRLLPLTGAMATEALLPLFLLAVIAGMFGGFLVLLANNCQNVDGAIAIANAISTCILAMTASLFLLAVVGAIAAVALIGIALLAVFVFGVAALCAAFDSASPKLTFMERFGKQLGLALGTLFDTVADLATKNIEEYSERLGSAADGIQAFVDSFAGLDGSQLSGLDSMLKAMEKFIGAEMWTGLGDWARDLLGGKEAWENSIRELGNSMKIFGEYTVNVDPGRIKAAAQAAEILSGIKISNIGNTSVLTQSVGQIGQAIAEFSVKVADIDTGKLTAARQFVEGISSMLTEASKIDPTGADNLGHSVNYIGEAIHNASIDQKVGNERKDGMVAVAQGMEAINNVDTSNVAKNGDVLGTVVDFIASGDGKEFAKEKISGAVGDMVGGGVTDGVMNGIQSFMGGDGKTYIMDSLGQMFQMPEGMSMDNMTSYFTDMAGQIPGDMGSIVSANSGDFTQVFSGFNAEAASNMGDTSAFYANGQAIAEAYKSGAMSVDVSSIGPYLTMQVADGLSSSYSSTEAYGRGLVVSFAASVYSSSGTLTSAGTNMVGAVKSGVTSSMGEIATLAKSISAQFAIGVQGSISACVTAGGYLVTGFIQGVVNKMGAAYAAARSVGAKAVQGLKDGTGEHSPSKYAKQVGKFLDQGLEIGIRKNQAPIYDAAYDAGSGAVDGMQAAVSRAAQILENVDDYEPTVRPLFDMSNITAGVGAIGDMFNNTSYGITARLNDLGVTNNSGRYKGSIDDVVDAVNGLGDQMGSMPAGNTYNVNGINYSEGSDVGDAIRLLVGAARMERRM